MTANEFFQSQRRKELIVTKNILKYLLGSQERIFIVVGDRVLIEPDEKGDRTSSRTLSYPQ